MTLANSPEKSLIIEAVAILSTQYNRRNVASLRGGFVITNFAQEEQMLNPGQSLTITQISEVVMLATDGDNVDMTITRDSESTTLSLKQMAVLSSPIDTLVVTNNAATGGPIIRVRAIYA